MKGIAGPSGPEQARVLGLVPRREDGQHGGEVLTRRGIAAQDLFHELWQRLLGRLAEALPELVEQVLRSDAPPRQNFAPVLAILAARHEAQYSRLFRS